MAEKEKKPKTTKAATTRKKSAAEGAPKTPKPRTRKKPESPDVSVPAEERMQLIREAAYRRAEQRGFEGGSPEEDWYEAEKEVEEKLRRRKKTPPLRGTKGTTGT